MPEERDVSGMQWHYLEYKIHKIFTYKLYLPQRSPNNCLSITTLVLMACLFFKIVCLPRLPTFTNPSWCKRNILSKPPPVISVWQLFYYFVKLFFSHRQVRLCTNKRLSCPLTVAGIVAIKIVVRKDRRRLREGRVTVSLDTSYVMTILETVKIFSYRKFWRKDSLLWYEYIIRW